MVGEDGVWAGAGAEAGVNSRGVFRGGASQAIGSADVRDGVSTQEAANSGDASGLSSGGGGALAGSEGTTPEDNLQWYVPSAPIAADMADPSQEGGGRGGRGGAAGGGGGSVGRGGDAHEIFDRPAVSSAPPPPPAPVPGPSLHPGQLQIV